MSGQQTKPDAQIHTKIESLADKRVVISGGTTGIGRATAILLASYGARLLIFGRHEDELKETLAQIDAAGGEGHGVVADQAKGEDVKRVFREVDEKLGGIDVLINNAAVAQTRLFDAAEEEWRYVVEVNLIGYLACTREAVARMREAEDGHIVNVGSMSADLREPNPLYVTTKAGIQAFSESLRKEVNPLGIRVSLVEPGLTSSDLAGKDDADKEAKIREHKMMKAEDVAVCIEYCLTQPKRMDVVAVQLRPRLQVI